MFFFFFFFVGRETINNEVEVVIGSRSSAHESLNVKTGIYLLQML